jgi:hypothetical protein
VRTCRPSRSRPDARLKVASFTVRASQQQARRWSQVARHLGCKSVPAWLEKLADEQARRVEERILPPRQ